MSRARGVDRNTLLGIVAILLWSATVALARSLSERLGPLTTGAAVYLAAGSFLGLHLFSRERSLRAVRELPRRYTLGCGSLFVLYTLALFVALGHATDRGQAIEIGLLNYLWPTLTILFALILLDQRAGAGLIPGTALALCGIFLVLNQGADVTWTSFVTNLSANPLAYGLGTLAAVAWALYSNLTRRWGGPDGRGAVLVFTLATGVAFLAGRLFRPERATWDVRVAVEIAALALTTALAYVCWDVAMRTGDVVLVASCSYLTPFLSTVVSCLYLQVRPGLSLWVGCALIIGGSLLSWKSVRRVT